ncbi:hypothetical protein WN51_09118 [Melipona quadrifasciata]|uniref:Uncharacterized protein n=1 Tax=Melipona quadrifasciata TaxID=166423 RepID=A0A0M9A9M4_9HYME|nr:hypothetical protein WN51_09118 [Melipona quadrifasciata]
MQQKRRKLESFALKGKGDLESSLVSSLLSGSKLPTTDEFDAGKVSKRGKKDTKIEVRLLVRHLAGRVRFRAIERDEKKGKEGKKKGRIAVIRRGC